MGSRHPLSFQLASAAGDLLTLPQLAVLRYLAILVGLSAPYVLPAQVVLYATSGNGNQSNLYTVNPANAQATLIGSVLAGTSPLVITGLAVHPQTGVLFGVTGAETGLVRRLVTIDPVTASATVIGSLITGSSDISFAANGALYSWTTRGGPLASVNTTTGAQTPIGTAANGSQGNGLAFAPNGNLYLAGPGANGLFTVNPTTGAITPVVAFSGFPTGMGGINALASDATGLLFATGRSSAELVSINATTGVVTSRGFFSFGEADALVFATAVPEPSTTVLLALGLIGGAVAFRRKKRR